MCVSSRGSAFLYSDFFYKLQFNCKFEPLTDNCLIKKRKLNSNYWSKTYSVSYRVTLPLVLNFLILLVLPVCISSMETPTKYNVSYSVTFLRNPSPYHFDDWSRSTGSAWSRPSSAKAARDIGDQLRREKFSNTCLRNCPFKESVG